MTPPRPRDRPLGFYPLPVRCPDCNRRQTMRAQMSYGAIDRCPHCNEILFVTILSQLQLAFVARISAEEWREFSGLPARDVLRVIHDRRRVA